MVKRLYFWLHRRFSSAEERGEYSAGYWQNKVRENVLRLCGSCCGYNVLEVGCGEGLFLAKFVREREGVRIYGVDLWGDILGRAQKRLQENRIVNAGLLQADGRFIPFKDNLFDLVVCVNVFFNLASEEMVRQSLSEISRVCKRGGRAIFDIRNSANPFIYLKYKFARYYDDTVKDLPLRTYRLKDVVACLERNNFRVAQKRYIGFPRNSLAPIIILEVKKAIC